MTPRERRLLADQAELRELDGSDGVEVVSRGPMPEQYTVTARGDGLGPGGNGAPVLRDEHRFDVYLPLGYPRQSPVVAWQTPIFHPNVLGLEDQGCVCVEGWGPSRSIGELCRGLIEMATYRAFDLERPLNRKAAEWVRATGLEPGGALRDAVAATGTPT
jgi:ubiquitin-protein ligase